MVVKMVEDRTLLLAEMPFVAVESGAELVYGQPDQKDLRQELEALMQAILTHKAFARLSSTERVAFQSDYTFGLMHLLRTGDCQFMFDEMEEWFEYLEELADYDEFQSDMQKQGIDLNALELADV
ncbi:MAG: hypothetical protein H8D78_12795 [Chloroflexi bacterium]|nr:hypothetical protein [Chloroflexota bacterium]